MVVYRGDPQDYVDTVCKEYSLYDFIKDPNQALDTHYIHYKKNDSGYWFDRCIAMSRTSLEVNQSGTYDVSITEDEGQSRKDFVCLYANEKVGSIIDIHRMEAAGPCAGGYQFPAFTTHKFAIDPTQTTHTLELMQVWSSLTDITPTCDYTLDLPSDSGVSVTGPVWDTDGTLTSQGVISFTNEQAQSLLTIPIEVSYSYMEAETVQIELNVIECDCNAIFQPLDLQAEYNLAYGTTQVLQTFPDFVDRQKVEDCSSICSSYNAWVWPGEQDAIKVAFEPLFDGQCTDPEACYQIKATVEKRSSQESKSLKFHISYGRFVYGSSDDELMSFYESFDVNLSGECPQVTPNDYIVLFKYYTEWDNFIPLDPIISSGNGNAQVNCPIMSYATDAATFPELSHYKQAEADNIGQWDQGGIVLSAESESVQIARQIQLSVSTELTTGVRTESLNVEVHVAEAYDTARCNEINEIRSMLGIKETYDVYLSEAVTTPPTEQNSLTYIPNNSREGEGFRLELQKRLRNCAQMCSKVGIQNKMTAVTYPTGPNMQNLAQIDLIETNQDHFVMIDDIESNHLDFCEHRPSFYTFRTSYTCRFAENDSDPFYYDEFTTQVNFLPGPSDDLASFQSEYTIALASPDTNTIQMPLVLFKLSENCLYKTLVEELTFLPNALMPAGDSWYSYDSETRLLEVLEEQLQDLTEAVTLQGTLTSWHFNSDIQERQSEMSFDFTLTIDPGQKCEGYELGFDATGIPQTFIVSLTRAADGSLQDLESKVDLPLPTPVSSILEACDYFFTKDITLYGDETLSTDWLDTSYLDEDRLVVRTESEAIQSLQDSLLVSVQYNVGVVLNGERVVGMNKAYDFVIAFEVFKEEAGLDPESEPEDEAVVEDEQVDQVSEEKESSSATDTSGPTQGQGSSDLTPSSQYDPQLGASPEIPTGQPPQSPPKLDTTPKPIKVTVVEVSETGRIVLGFSRAFALNLDEPQTRRRSLSAQSKAYEQLILDAIITRFEPGSADPTEDFDVPQLPVPIISSRTINKITDKTIDLQISFENSEAVSVDSLNPDRVLVDLDHSVFTDPESPQRINEGTSLILEMPRQIDKSIAEQIVALMSTANSAANAVATTNVVINIFLGSSLKYLWGMINTLQFVVFFTEWNAQLPPNAQIAIVTFRVIALGEFLPYEWLTDPINDVMGSEPEDEADTQSDEGEKTSVLANMGIMLLIGLIMFFVVALVLLCFRFCKKGGKLHNVCVKIRAKLLWNSVIRFLLQSYLKNSIVCLTAVAALSFANSTATINSLIALAIYFALCSLPSAFGLILYRNRAHLDSEPIVKQIGSLYVGTKTHKARHYTFIVGFLVRRLCYAFLTVACLKQPNLCVHAFLLLNVLFIEYYVGWAEPHDTDRARRMEIFNDVGLQVAGYHLAVFPLSVNLQDESNLGYSMIGCVCIIFAVNLVVIVSMTISVTKRKFYLKGLKQKRDKAIKARQVAKALQDQKGRTPNQVEAVVQANQEASDQKPHQEDSLSLVEIPELPDQEDGSLHEIPVQQAVEEEEKVPIADQQSHRDSYVDVSHVLPHENIPLKAPIAMPLSPTKKMSPARKQSDYLLLPDEPVDDVVRRIESELIATRVSAKVPSKVASKEIEPSQQAVPRPPSSPLQISDDESQKSSARIEVDPVAYEKLRTRLFEEMQEIATQQMQEREQAKKAAEQAEQEAKAQQAQVEEQQAVGESQKAVAIVKPDMTIEDPFERMRQYVRAAFGNNESAQREDSRFNQLMEPVSQADLVMERTRAQVRALIAESDKPKKGPIPPVRPKRQEPWPTPVAKPDSPMQVRKQLIENFRTGRQIDSVGTRQDPSRGGKNPIGSIRDFKKGAN